MPAMLLLIQTPFQIQICALCTGTFSHESGAANKTAIKVLWSGSVFGRGKGGGWDCLGCSFQACGDLFKRQSLGLQFLALFSCVFYAGVILASSQAASVDSDHRKTFADGSE